MTEETTGETAMQYGGLNHLALVSRDMAETVDFYENVLGMRCVRSIEGENTGQHFFFDCGNGATIAFFWWPDAPAVTEGVSSQYRDQHDTKTAIGSMNHVAIHISPEHFDEYAERLTAKGVSFYTRDHDDSASDPTLTEPWCRSIYMFDPNGIKVELCAFLRPFQESDVFCEPMNAKGERVPMLLESRRQPVSA